MAGQIGVRAYVSEAAAHKSVAHRAGLGRAVLQDEPAAGFQVRAGLRNDLLDRLESGGARNQGDFGLEAADSGGEVGVAARDVGRIRGDDVETPARERREPAAALEA